MGNYAQGTVIKMTKNKNSWKEYQQMLIILTNSLDFNAVLY
jgi:hypothetical protein